jgi:hypothetical protein
MPNQLDMPAEMLWHGRTALLAYGKRASGDLPDPSAQYERRLFGQAVGAVTGGPGTPPDVVSSYEIHTPC